MRMKLSGVRSTKKSYEQVWLSCHISIFVRMQVQVWMRTMRIFPRAWTSLDLLRRKAKAPNFKFSCLSFMIILSHLWKALKDFRFFCCNFDPWAYYIELNENPLLWDRVNKFIDSTPSFYLIGAFRAHDSYFSYWYVHLYELSFISVCLKIF